MNKIKQPHLIVIKQNHPHLALFGTLIEIKKNCFNKNTESQTSEDRQICLSIKKGKEKRFKLLKISSIKMASIF